MLVSMKNIVNDYYSKDISRKISATIDTKRANGPHYLGPPPYGYEMSTRGPKHYVIDKEAAPFVHLNFQWAQEGVSFHQIAMNLTDMNVPTPKQHYERKNKKEMDAVKSLIVRYQGNPNQVYMIGDSAGAYLIAYAVAMQNSPELAGAAHVHPSSLPIQALGLISGMFYTRKLDKIGLFLPNFLYGSGYRKTSFAPYTNPEHPAITKNLPPCYLVTSKDDMLQHYTLNFAKALRKPNTPYHLLDLPANRKLTHAFCVFEPEMPESINTIHDMTNFLRHFPVKK